MTRYLAGLHDREGARHVPAGGWCLDTIALNDRPQPFDYARFEGVEWIVRMNMGYGSTGTIPRPARYAEFADLCAQYVLQSRGVTRWIIGNEPNHSVERPDGQPITPENYAVCFNLCRQAIQAVRPLAQVIPAPVAPWNVESGDWLDYWQTVLAGIDGCEGLAVHSYIHEADPNLVNSDAKMDAPFQDRHFQFAAYRDTLARVPDRLRHLPVYLTEANPLSGWRAAGIIPAMLDHVDAWNLQPATQRIQCVIFYRYPPFDRWGMSDKPAVMAEFRQHAQRRPSPEPRRIDETQEPPVNPTPPQPVTPLPPRAIDERFFQRVPDVKLSDGTPGKTHYRLVRAEYVEDGARRFGPDHHILVDVLDRDGNRKLGTPVVFFWVVSQEVRNTDKPSEPYAVDFPMHAAGHSYGVKVTEDGASSDEAFGMGMGKLGSEHMGDHVSYFLIFRETMPDAPVVPRPQPTETGQTLYVHAPGDGLKIRAGPGVSYAQVGGLEHGASVTVYEVKGENQPWARVDTGWVAHWLLSDRPPAPVVTPPVEPTPPMPSGDCWARAYPFILRWEGGWADHPSDPGGATMKGITIGTYTRWRASKGQPQPTKSELRNISDAEVEAIYRAWYWKASGADKLPWPLCLAVFDTAVNGGVGRAQDILARSGGDFLRFMGILIDWYTRIDNFEYFGRAWIRRRAEILLEAAK